MQPDAFSGYRCSPALIAKDGDALFDHDRHTLEELGKQLGTLALILGARSARADGLFSKLVHL